MATRAIRTEDKKKEVEKIRIQEVAESMKSMLDEYVAEVEKKLLRNILILPPGDIGPVQAEYKAAKAMVEWLDIKILNGKKAYEKLKEEK